MGAWKDPERAAKWQRRGDDWTRIADHAQEDSVHKICHDFAGWAYDMARLFGWKD